MADQPVEAASNDEAGGGSGKGKKTLIMGGVLAGIMLVEGVGLYVGMKLLGAGPEQAPAGQGLIDPGQARSSEMPEVPIVKIKVPNRKSGKTYLYDVEVAATLIVPEDKEPAVYKKEIIKTIEDHESAIRDRLSFLIRSSDPEQLDEPGLVMIRRRIKAELEKVLCRDKLFDKILLPRWTPLRADM